MDQLPSASVSTTICKPKEVVINTSTLDISDSFASCIPFPLKSKYKCPANISVDNVGKT